MKTYYNENDRFCVEWLGNLATAGLIPGGCIDGRSIKDVRADDLAGVDRAHFFAGIAGWELALQLAGWLPERQVWTGSCPCQPFSQAGRRRGFADERHLWPVWRELIRECRPATIFGEQVASKDGRLWFSGVRADLEALGYAVGGADLCAAGVSAPQIRQRLWWVASAGFNQQRMSERFCSTPLESKDESKKRLSLRGGSPDNGVGYSDRPRRAVGVGIGSDDGEKVKTTAGEVLEQAGPWSDYIFAECSDGKARRIKPGIVPLVARFPSRVGQLRSYGNAIVPQEAAEFVMAFMETGSCGGRSAGR